MQYKEFSVYNLYSKFNCSTVFRWLLALVLICCAATFIYAQETIESTSDGDDMFGGTQQAAIDKHTIKPIRTDSPRVTLTSFFRLRDELEETLQVYRSNKSYELAEKLQVFNAQFHALLDLSSVPPASRHAIGPKQLLFYSTSLGVSNCLILKVFLVKRPSMMLYHRRNGVFPALRFESSGSIRERVRKYFCSANAR